MMKKLLTLILFVPCILCVQAKNDIAARAKAKTEELKTQGWKVHADAKPLYDQVYSALAFAELNETEDPMNVLYTGKGIGEHNCISEILVAFAKKDIQDWYKDFVDYASSCEEHGLFLIRIASKLIYPEYEISLYSSDVQEERFSIKTEEIDKSLWSNWKQLFQPFVQVYREVNGREDMVIGRFTDEFLTNRRIPVPVFEGYKIAQPKDTTSKAQDYRDIIKETNLHTTKNGVREECSIQYDNYHYLFKSVYRIIISEERLKLLAEVYYKVEESSKTETEQK